MEILRFSIISITLLFSGFMTFVFLTDLAKPLPMAEIDKGQPGDVGTTPRKGASAPKPPIVHSYEEASPTPVPTTQSHVDTDDVLLKIRALTKRDLRKVLTPLGVQQKRNGKEITTEMAVAKIAKLYKENPQPVTTVLCQKLPNKFPSPTNPSVQLTETA